MAFAREPRSIVVTQASRLIVRDRQARGLCDTARRPRQDIPLHFFVAPHQLKKAERVTNGMDAADFVGINRADWY